MSFDVLGPESAGEESQRREIEAWFRERRVTLEYHIVGDEGDVWDCVAMMVPDDYVGVIEGGGGSTKLAAAADAQERYRAKHGEAIVQTVTPGGAIAGGNAPTEIVGGAGGISSEETVGTPSVTQIEPPSLVRERAVGVPTVEVIPESVRAPLERIAGEFGWYFTYVLEPDGGFRWFLFERDGDTLLKTGVADGWDDALLATVEGLQPPSGEA